MATDKFDIRFRNATVVDGSGRPAFGGDVGVIADRIVAVGDLGETPGRREVDATGLVLCPGFIDVHTHDDRALLRDPGMPAKVSQGVTTVITGNCGVSLAPLISANPPAPLDLLAAGDATAFHYGSFADYVADLEAHPPAINAGLLVGHSTLRAGVMDDLDREATDAQIALMRAMVAEAAQAGAIGFSSGLFYPASRAANRDEVAAILAEVDRPGFVYTTHMRDEGRHIDEALEESFETARKAGIPLVISHHKCLGKANFGRSVETLARIDRARAGHEIGIDAYPYAAGSSVLLRELVEQSHEVLISWSLPHPECAGRNLADIAADWGISAVDAADRLRPGGAIYHLMDQADVDRIIAHPDTMIGSDGLPHDRSPHPRLWGTFPKVLRHYVRERGLLSLEEAVYRMTGLSARTFGLSGRGEIAPGAFADIVLFDPERIADMATYDAPTQPAAGISGVYVNGCEVFDGKEHLAVRPGRVLKH